VWCTRNVRGIRKHLQLLRQHLAAAVLLLQLNGH